jgi:hypothetical protein
LRSSSDFTFINNEEIIVHKEYQLDSYDDDQDDRYNYNCYSHDSDYECDPSSNYEGEQNWVTTTTITNTATTNGTNGWYGWKNDDERDWEDDSWNAK